MGQNKNKNALKNRIAYFRFALSVGHYYKFGGKTNYGAKFISG